MARKIVEAGGAAVMCDVNADVLAAVASEINATGPGRAYACVSDVRKFSDAEKASQLAIEKEGRIDLLVTFAGGYEPRMCNSMMPFYEQPIEVIDWGIDVNLKGAIYFARACMPEMVKAGKGVICCIGSVTGFEGDGNGAMYGTAKSGLFNFVKGIAQSGAPHGVRAFCVTPGPVMTRPGMANMKTLQGHAAEPEELVEFILFLSSDACRCVTGSNHVMDCGRLSLQIQ
ncbi:MAG: SDR family oxidoreductase [Eubacteriales bacterium]|nr:SDR family oxidoreductase [Eubacteriales bacterium]